MRKQEPWLFSVIAVLFLLVASASIKDYSGGGSLFDLVMAALGAAGVVACGIVVTDGFRAKPLSC